MSHSEGLPLLGVSNWGTEGGARWRMGSLTVLFLCFSWAKGEGGCCCLINRVRARTSLGLAYPGLGLGLIDACLGRMRYYVRIVDLGDCFAVSDGWRAGFIYVPAFGHRLDHAVALTCLFRPPVGEEWSVGFL